MTATVPPGPTTKTVSVVVPVYYNEHSLPHLFAALLEVEAALAARQLALELIFVDDGSGDASFAALLELKRRRPATRVIRLTRNFGAIHASKVGYQFVTGDCLVTLAADLQDPPSLIPQMAESWQQGAKYVVCTRTNRLDPLPTRLFAALYYMLVRLLVVKNYPTGGYDLTLMDSAFLPHLQHSSKNINPHLFAHWLGFPPVVIPYVRAARVHGKSRWTFTKKAKFLLDSLLGFSIVPIRLISATGVAVAAASFLYGTIIVINALRGSVDERGFATVVTLIAFLLGLVIMMLGLIGEYIWRIFDEVSRRPEAVIAEIH